MALSRSLLWFSPSLCSPPAAPAAAVERIKVHLLRNPKPQLQTCVSRPLPWAPRGFGSRVFRGGLIHVASTTSSDARGRDAAAPPKQPDEDVGEESLARKPPRRRRRTKKKVEEATTSSNGTGKGAADEPVASRDDDPLITAPEPISRELGGAESPSATGVVRRDPTDSATELNNTSSFPSSREIANGSSGRAVTPISGTGELEQSPAVPRKKKRRSKKAKETGEVSNNGTVSALDSAPDQVGRISTHNDSANERISPPKNGNEGERSRTTEQSVALEFAPVSLDNSGEESGAQLTKKRKRRSKKKPVVVDPERRQANGRKDAENSTESVVDAPLTENCTSESNGYSRREGEEQPGPQSGEASPKTRKRRGRKKATRSKDLVVDNGEPAGNDNGRGSSHKDLPSQSSQERSTPDSENGNGTENSGDVQNQIPASDPVEGGEVAITDDPAKPAKKGKRWRQRKKKASTSLQTDVSQDEVIAPSAEDLFESIVWCTVHLKVQAELEENERLFVVGANPELGGWDLSQALPLFESDDEEGVCENTLKIPRGTMLDYKYFTEARDAVTADIQKWFGPEVQYFLPWKHSPDSEIEIIRDTWIPDVPAKLPVLSWGERWWEDLEGHEGHEGQDGDDQLLGYGRALNSEQEALDSAEKKGEPAEEPVLDDWLKKRIRKKVFPREEPWLLESMIMDQRNGSIRKDIVEGTEGGTESVDAEPKDSEVQVEILINSPQCTMQRMAILEDGKLVELLVEPVNTRVQVGNLYLGVVRQLLPGMTGVFVDIGNFQLALLDITRNQYPYTFPSIGQSIDIPGGGDGQAWGSLDDDEESDWEEGDSEDEDEDEDDEDGDFLDDEEGDDEAMDEDVEEDASRRRSSPAKGRGLEGGGEDFEARDTRAEGKVGSWFGSLPRTDSGSPITVNFGRKLKKWRRLQEGMKIIVQVKKEAFGKKGPRLTAFPSLAGRFWVLIPGGNAVGVSRRVTWPERKRLRELALDMLPANFSLTVRTEAVGHGREELEKDLARLMETWKQVLERASAAAVAAEHGMEGAMPVLLHRAMGQFLAVVRDFFNNKVHRMVIDSPQCYQEITSYLQEVAPQLSERVELYTDKIPIFDAFGIEPEIEKFSNRRVSLPSGGYLVLEETEALVSIDVNGGTGVLSHDVSQEDAILAVNLAAARQIATELRLRDIGGIIVVDFIDMGDPKSEKMVVDEMWKAVARDRSSPALSEISAFGLMEMTRKRVRPSVTLTISDPCTHCVGVGRVEAHETTLSKIERAVLRLLAARPGRGDTSSSDSTKWPQLVLRVDNDMGEYLKGRNRKRMTQLSAALKVWLNLKVVLEFNTGQFQVLEQRRTGSEKRSNGSGQSKSSQQNVGPGLSGKRGVWPGRRRRNFANQVSAKE